MNKEIDQKLNCFWCAYIGPKNAYTTWFDKENSDEAEWFKLMKSVESGESEMIGISLFGQRKLPTQHYFSIPVAFDKDGYFFAKRASITFGDGSSSEQIGAGYLENDIVKITWYNMQLEAMMFEERKPEDCGFSLIRCKNKNTTATSSQA